MKTAEWKRTVRPLLPSGQSWAFHGQLCYRQPVDWVLTGVLGEGSGFHAGVYVWRVTMPLFIPSDHLTLNFSSRVGGGTRFYDMDEHTALQQAISTALATTEATEPLQVIASHQATKNPRLFEGRAYARILLGDLDAAAPDLSVAAASEGQDTADRATLIRGLLGSDGTPGVVRQLACWRDMTCAALGIGREPKPS
jgi:hypothetical protein